ncbi:hypothetical protein CEXT_132111 [Caerostris extrusa]|uniref:Secreted protein n=1 Tax=Caerostris extrusa TaxID=172846 RepID=A0AAV4WF65_CAEEX|nr:hypothetical protein CEXT_132111 [Caerostris extrusa]
MRPPAALPIRCRLLAFLVKSQMTESSIWAVIVLINFLSGLIVSGCREVIPEGTTVNRINGQENERMGCDILARCVINTDSENEQA